MILHHYWSGEKMSYQIFKIEKKILKKIKKIPGVISSVKIESQKIQKEDAEKEWKSQMIITYFSKNFLQRSPEDEWILKKWKK